MAQPIWNTTAGNLGTFPAGLEMSITLYAEAVLPSTSINFYVQSGSLPQGCSMNQTGVITGTPTVVSSDTKYDFTIRVIDNNGFFRDRSFYILVSGAEAPAFTSEEGKILTVVDSTWVEKQIEYSNPIASNSVTIGVLQGELPPGLEINETGLIRGYPKPPVLTSTLAPVLTRVTASSSVTNTFTCDSTANFQPGRRITFSGLVFGGVIATVGTSETYYFIRTVESPTTFTIAATQLGPVMNLSDGSGNMTAILPSVQVGAPAVKTYNFTLALLSELGNDTASYSITVSNERLNNPPNTRVPAILNNRPLSFTIDSNDQYFSYYTQAQGDSNYIGKIFSGNEFYFKILGYDFDDTLLIYDFVDLPLGMVGDSVTGWVRGTPTLSSKGISRVSFQARAVKATSASISSPFVSFTMDVVNDINPTITWISNSNLGTIINGTISNLRVDATAEETIYYRITSGSLPPSLTLLDNGEIAGRVAFQPGDSYIDYGDSSIYTFTIEAYSDIYPLVKSTKEFTLTVLQDIRYPLETVYFKATPSLSDRALIDELLSNTTLIPDEYLYRKLDPYFGKATNVIYPFAYSLTASTIEQYLAAINKNHYWKNITLGELKTAQARNENNEVIYEVVYSEIIDDLVNPEGTSVNKTIYWQRQIELDSGPWYASATDVYANYDFAIDGHPTYYASLTPETVIDLYPNSLENMRKQLTEYIPQNIDSRLLPLWMTSQQSNGSTLGFTKAWVLCYTLPGYAEQVKNNINNNWDHTLNQINFTIDRYTVDKSYTYNYNSNFQIPTWNAFPSATPVPDPLDSNDFYVLFPTQTILPGDGTQ